MANAKIQSCNNTVKYFLKKVFADLFMIYDIK